MPCPTAFKPTLRNGLFDSASIPDIPSFEGLCCEDDEA
jgi:hypothetical protein